MTGKAKPIFNKRIFWDVVFENIDYHAKANFVIERVFERGDVDDIRNCRRYYGDDKVKEALLNAKFLPEATMYLASAVVQLSRFCMGTENPLIWIYFPAKRLRTEKL